MASFVRKLRLLGQKAPSSWDAPPQSSALDPGPPPGPVREDPQASCRPGVVSVGLCPRSYTHVAHPLCLSSWGGPTVARNLEPRDLACDACSLQAAPLVLWPVRPPRKGEGALSCGHRTSLHISQNQCVEGYPLRTVGPGIFFFFKKYSF